MSEDKPDDMLMMTAEIVTSYVANNSVTVGDVSALIGSVHAALGALGDRQPVETADSKPQGAVGIRKSLSNPAHIISMIDGKPYLMLTRHIKGHGYTPQSYRQAFGLPADYPLTAPSYSEKRRTLAKAIGLGRKKAEPAPPPPAPKAKRARPNAKVA
jgi:predicted transcriptional regulator